jgi:hypothetical protein
MGENVDFFYACSYSHVCREILDIRVPNGWEAKIKKAMKLFFIFRLGSPK